MRRTAAALALATLGLMMFVAPVAEADVAPPVDQIRCGTAGPPVCELLQELQGQLAPVQSVLKLAGPAVQKVGATAQGLLAQSTSSSGVSSTDALAATTALQQALAVLPAPVSELLGATALGQLQSTLDQLVTALSPVTEPVLGKPATTGGAKPTVMTPTPAPATATPFAGGSETAAGLDGAALDSGSTSSSDLPDVPNGDLLDLGPLALPDFGWTAEVPAAAALDAAPTPVEQDQARLVAAAVGGPHGARTGVVVVAFSALLGAVALAVQWWQSQKALHTIPD